MSMVTIQVTLRPAVFFIGKAVGEVTAPRSTGSTEEFMAIAERVSGEDLDALFEIWLFTPEKPPLSALQGPAAG